MNKLSLDCKVQMQREEALRYINKFTHKSEFNEYSNRIKSRYPHLLDLALMCERKGNYVENDNRLPPPMSHDSERVDLRECWLLASEITGRIGPRTLAMVKKYGYRDAMLKQIKNINDIGSNGYIQLKLHNALQYSAEYLLRKHYTDMLTAQQIKKIDNVLAEANINIQ